MSKAQQGLSQTSSPVCGSRAHFDFTLWCPETFRGTEVHTLVLHTDVTHACSL